MAGKNSKQRKRKAVSNDILSLSMKPALLSGALCASRSSAVDPDDSPLPVSPINIPLEDFFGAEFASAEDVQKAAEKLPGAEKACTEALSATNLLEENLRDAVFTELLYRGIKFPPRCQQKMNKQSGKRILCYSRKRKELNPISAEEKHYSFDQNQKQDFFYKESQIKNILEASSSFFIPNVEEQQLVRLMNGLLVTTTSLPDMVPFQETNHEGLKMIRMGEFKNKSNYIKRHACSQCFAYLYSLMYYIRVMQGIPLETVYGFGFCGNACHDSDGKYSVGLFKLQAPLHLGQTFRTEQYWQTFDTSDDGGIKLLHLYLAQGKLWDMASAQQQKVGADHRGPAIFAAPRSFWIPKPEEDFHIVSNGTRAIVFKANYDGIRKLLQDAAEGGIPEYIETFDTEEVPGDRKTKKFYVKIRTHDTSYNFRSVRFGNLYMKSRKGRGEFWSDFRETYFVEPYVDDNTLIIVMADRGTRISERFKTVEEARTLLNPLKAYMDTMAKAVFHGDFLPHNFLMDDGGVIRVIDHDEAGHQVVGRRINGDEEAEWQSAIRYPNALRENRKEYTEIQFASSLIALAPADVVKDTLQGLVFALQKLGNWLMDYDSVMEKSPLSTGDIDKEAKALIDEVNKRVQDFLNPSAGAPE